MRAAHFTLDSANIDRSKSRRLPALFNYSVAFDPNDPVNTPRGLNTSENTAVMQSLGLAVETLNRAGIPLNAKLGDIQTVTRGESIPWHGGEEFEGVFNKAVNTLDETAGGYPEATGSGASWVTVTEFTADGYPGGTWCTLSPRTMNHLITTI